MHPAGEGWWVLSSFDRPAGTAASARADMIKGQHCEHACFHSSFELIAEPCECSFFVFVLRFVQSHVKGFDQDHSLRCESSLDRSDHGSKQMDSQDSCSPHFR